LPILPTIGMSFRFKLKLIPFIPKRFRIKLSIKKGSQLLN
jgi:hypothetical protein